MADLKVDTAMLRDTVASLQYLKDQFSGIDGLVGGSEWAVGASTVQSALHDFADNWRRHRDALVKSIDAVLEMAKKAAETYEQADTKLAQGLHVQQSGGGRP